jgi:hypothetical protein
MWLVMLGAGLQVVVVAPLSWQDQSWLEKPVAAVVVVRRPWGVTCSRSSLRSVGMVVAQHVSKSHSKIGVSSSFVVRSTTSGIVSWGVVTK